jgi:pimeloyl-ACP methyl ester carboxylesterase
MTRARAHVPAALAALAFLASAVACTAQISGHGTTTLIPGSPSASPPTSLPPAPPQSAANFADCTRQVNKLKLTIPAPRAAKLTWGCARISVPLDYADTAGKQISLFLLRAHDSDNRTSHRSLIVNPGGPGGSGIQLALGLAGRLSSRVLSHFDLVGFDPRGVGLSSPVKCLSKAEKDRFVAASPDVRSAAGFASAKSQAETFAAACERKYGSSLADYDTVQSARDLDQIRQAVGDPQINYLGFSYGTELGAQYIHLFPQHVRVAVLDGAVDPLLDPITSARDQLQGFEDAFDQFAAWCRKHAPCSGLGDPRQAVYRILDASRKSPIPSSAPHETRKATPNLVLTAVSEAMYSEPEWATLGRALIAARDGDSKGLLQLADEYNQRLGGQYTNLIDAFNTISCNDSPPGPSDDRIKSLARTWAAQFPMFGESFAAGLFICQQWQPDRSVPPLPTAPETPHKVLVVGNVHDPATPYQGAKDLAKTLGNAELLTWNGEGHTSYLEGSSCIDHYVDDYLVAGSLPPAGTTCR